MRIAELCDLTSIRRSGGRCPVATSSGRAGDISAAQPPQFSHHDVRTLYSVAHLFPRNNRAGVYILFGSPTVNWVRRPGNRRGHPVQQPPPQMG